MGKESGARKKKKKKEKKPTFIPLTPIPDESAELEEELKEIFEEDRVTHKHGGTEPERD